MKKEKKHYFMCFLLALFIFASLIGCTEVDDNEVPANSPVQITEKITSVAEPKADTKPTTEPELPLTEAILPTSEPTVSPNAAPTPTPTPAPTKVAAKPLSLSEIPEYKGDAYVAVRDNKPSFPEEDCTGTSFESYSPLDRLGRCGIAYANIGRDLMPEGERGEIGMVKPAGWHTVKYDSIDGLYLYNRCHLIGWQLSGENANERNLITGTRYLNVQGMLPFENMVAEYVKRTDNHVLYRVTPLYNGDNLICAGIQIEGLSVEDNGKGICFNVFCYNVQPGISIDYANGDSYQVGQEEEEEPESVVTGTTYTVNKNTKKFHYPYCSSADDIKPQNRKEFTGDRGELIESGYSPCKRCNP